MQSILAVRQHPETIMQLISPKELTQSYNSSIKLQAYLLTKKEEKLYRILKAWRYYALTSSEDKEQEMKSRRQIRLKFRCFKNLKIETTQMKKATIHYQQKLYKNFFMVVSGLLQQRYKFLYVEELRRMNGFKRLLTNLRQNQDQAGNVQRQQDLLSILFRRKMLLLKTWKSLAYLI